MFLQKFSPTFFYLSPTVFSFPWPSVLSNRTVTLYLMWCFYAYLYYLYEMGCDVGIEQLLHSVPHGPTQQDTQLRSLNFSYPSCKYVWRPPYRKAKAKVIQDHTIIRVRVPYPGTRRLRVLVRTGHPRAVVTYRVDWRIGLRLLWRDYPASRVWYGVFKSFG